LKLAVEKQKDDYELQLTNLNNQILDEKKKAVANEDKLRIKLLELEKDLNKDFDRQIHEYLIDILILFIYYTYLY